MDEILGTFSSLQDDLGVHYSCPQLLIMPTDLNAYSAACCITPISHVNSLRHTADDDAVLGFMKLEGGSRDDGAAKSVYGIPSKQYFLALRPCSKCPQPFSHPPQRNLHF